MNIHSCQWHITTAIFLLGFLLMLTVACFADSPKRLKEDDLLQGATWLNELHDYEFSAEFSIETSGMKFGVAVLHRALEPDYFITEFSIPMMEKIFYCDGDSLWIELPDFSTFTVEPWQRNSMSEIEGDLYVRFMEGPPYPFDILKRLVAPELVDEFEYRGEEDLCPHGQTFHCELWDNTNTPRGHLADHIWIDRDLSILLQLEGTDEGKKGKGVTIKFKVLTLKTNMGLKPEDFKFSPKPGFKRVTEPSKLFVSNSLEGKTFNDFDFTDLTGSTVNSDQWRGKIVLLDFWATWCGPCKKSLPHLKKLQADFAENLLVVGVTTEKIETVKEFFKDDPSPYPILLDQEGKAVEKYEVANWPTLFILDANGKILDHFVGYQEESVIRKAIEKALDK